jgi:hypothetical protein
MAVAAYGGTRLTDDIDLAIAFDVENRRAAVRALATLNPRPPRLAPGADWVWDEFSLRSPWSIFETDAGRVDLIVRLPGVDSFGGLFERSEVHDVGGHRLRIASITDLMAMKAAAARDRDRDDYNQLRAILELRGESASPPQN